MTPTIATLIGGLALLLIGAGLLGTLLGVRATLSSFSDIETGLIMAGYYVGYIAGTMLVPRVIRNVGHIRAFAALASLAAACVLSFGLLVHPAVWLPLRIVNGLSVVGLYMVVESWLSEQSAGPSRGRIFSLYMMSTLFALGLGQFLLLVGDPGSLVPFALAAMLMALGVIPIAVTRVTAPQIATVVPVKLKELMKISPLGTVGALGAGMVNGAFWGMTAVFGQRLDLGELQIALLMSSTILGGAVLQWPIGHLSDRFDRRNVLILVSFATAAVAAGVAVLIMHGLPGLTLGAALYGGLMFSLYGISVAHTNDHIAHGQVLEATRGLLLVYGVGALFGPLLGGIAMQIAGPVGLPALSAGMAGLLALYGVYRRTQRVAPPLEEQTEFVPLVRTTPVVLEMHPATPASNGPGSESVQNGSDDDSGHGQGRIYPK
ncbi:MAG: MFS transporter [Gammaproteobacteria bacterium]|nr:MFS transporter [Gammaproteobacteria bacterium]